MAEPMTPAQQILHRAKLFLESDHGKAYLTDYFRAAQHAAQASGWNPQSAPLFDDARKVGAFFQHFWDALPDSPSIRTTAFFDVCDIAELYSFELDS